MVTVKQFGRGYLASAENTTMILKRLIKCLNSNCIYQILLVTIFLTNVVVMHCNRCSDINLI